MGRIDLPRWFFHQNFIMFLISWILIMSSTATATVEHLPATPNFGKQKITSFSVSRSEGIQFSVSPSNAANSVVLVPRGGELASLSIAVKLLIDFWAMHRRTILTLVSGATAGIVSRTFTSPLEVIATLQMSGAGPSGSLVSQLVALYEADGVKAYFRGNGANCLKVAPNRAIQFAVYGAMSRIILKRAQAQAKPGAEVSLTPYGRLVAGGVAGMVACTIVYPLEVVKTMLTVNPGAYAGILDAFRQAYADGGIQGFYKGWLPTFVAMFPYVGVEFMIYESLKQRWATTQAALGKSQDLPPHYRLAIGALAGAAAQSSAHPLDVVRRRLQMQGKGGRPVEFSNMFDGLYKLGSTEGMRALYRGLKPACFEKIPSTAMTFFTYEFLKFIFQI